jgi:type I restriction enzyme M protein
MNNHSDRVGFIWSVADLLRGTYKQSQYGKVILPLVVIRRLDAALESTKDAVQAELARSSGTIFNLEPLLSKAAGQSFYNTSPLGFTQLLDDPEHLAGNLRSYIAAFSPGAAEVIEKFAFDTEITTMSNAGLLYQVIARFSEIDLHPEVVSNHEMGYIYEELIRKFSELSNETAGEHFTPREVIRLMVNLLFAEDDHALVTPGTVRTIYDPACGTGGMLSVAEEYLREFNPQASLVVFGQELNAETYAVCRSDMMIKGQDPSNIHFGNSLTVDGTEGAHFHYMLSNPPFGVEWKAAESVVKTEAQTKGFAGRFGAGLPRINDGSFLFLQHMISKMKPASEGGSRIAIVFNGSPLFTGAAGSGESEIRRWIIENDWLDAVVALPDQLFYNTGISIYIWIVTNRKSPERAGKVQVIDAREYYSKMRKSLGEKRKEMSEDKIAEVTRIYSDFQEGEFSKIFANEFFGYQRITVERPLRLRWRITEESLAALEKSKPWKALVAKGWSFTAEEIYGEEGKLRGFRGTTWEAPDEMVSALAVNHGGGVPMEIIRELVKLSGVSDPEGALQTDSKGKAKPDPDLRDNENIPLPERQVRWEEDLSERLSTAEYRQSVAEYVQREVLPWVPDAWVDHTKTKVGYEIPLTRQFYKYVPPRPVAVIDAELHALEEEILELMEGRS